MTGMEIAEVLGNLGDFIGAIAVFGTIVYLAIQVRLGREATDANTAAIRESRRFANAQAIETRNRWQTDAVRFWVRGDERPIPFVLISLMDRLGDMTDEDLQSELGDRIGDAIGYLLELLYTWEASFRQYQLGYLDEEEYESIRVQIGSFGPLLVRLHLPVHNRGRSFVEEFENLIGNPPKELYSSKDYAMARDIVGSPTTEVEE